MSEDQSNLTKLLDAAVEKKFKEREEANTKKDHYQILADKIDASIKQNHDHNDNDVGHKHDTDDAPSDTHVHATHSSDKTCKTCGEKNPDYNPDQATCTICGKDVGTVKEIEAGQVTTCKNCGGHEAEHKSLGYSL